MFDCNGCYLGEIYESADERLRCLHRITCERAYQQGKSDKYQEIVSAYMLLTEEQVKEIRTDAIDEFASMLIADLGIAGYTKDTRSGHETYMCYELLDAIEELRERLEE